MVWTYYPTPNVTGFSDVFTYMNTVTGGMFWNIFALVLFVIIFIANKRHKSQVAFGVASYITFLVVILLRILLLVKDEVVIAMLVVTAISIFLLMREDWFD